MTFGLISISRSWVLCLLLLTGSTVDAEIVPIPDDQAEASWTVEQVLASLKEGRQPSVSFEETIFSSLLSKPLIVRGVLHFAPPSRLEKEVLEPYRERYVIEEDRVTFESERKHMKKNISLEDYPALLSFVEAFRASFTGDAAQLREVYEPVLEGTRRKWSLLLRPRDPTGKTLVESILFSGSDGHLATITIQAPDGDRSVMTLSRGSSK